ncbi:hypothetical protein X777_00183 [Ooceraea biroi]|uniref:Uncharacterized protein n=1 Tax=Ooceraea biroi TaxID=2015173 RepID=A0A026VS01_OOCBI|nr:hypothetical protein X777_00183 [Ooceraea biroi]
MIRVTGTLSALLNNIAENVRMCMICNNAQCIGSDTFEFLDGVVGIAFSPRLGTVYYQPLATDRIFSVPSSALQAGPVPFGEQLPVTLVGRKSSQGLALAVDPRDDTILFSPFTETAIASWQPRTNQQRYEIPNKIFLIKQ